MEPSNITLENNTIINKSSSGLSRLISALDKVNPVTRWLFYIAGGVLALYTLLVAVDVVLRYVFGHPLQFSQDLGGMVMPVFLFLAAGWVQVEKGHMVIDVISSKLSRKTNLILTTVMYIICLVVTAIVVWRSAITSISFLELGSKTQTGLPLFPSAIMIPIGSFFLFIAILRDILAFIDELIQIKTGFRGWLIALGCPIIILVLMALGMTGFFSGINLNLLGLCSIVFLFVVMFLGMPLGLTFIMISVVLTSFASGPSAGFMLAGRTLYTQTADYNWSVIPLFTFMSYIFMASGMGKECFLAAYKWIGHFKGGLALATIVACVAFASVNGGPLPAIIIMGTIGLTEMRKYRYSDELSTGAILAGSTLGPMIPPSVTFIIYGLICQESIGKLFIAGIIPGLLLAFSFIVVILVLCRINPKLGPAGPKFTWHERLESTSKFVPILLLFLLVIGGIYAGIFSSMEGGGIGAFGALIIALAIKSFSWKNFKTSMVESAKMNSMLLFVIVGGLLFGNSLGATGLSAVMVEFTRSIGLTPLLFVLAILVIYMIWGIVCDEPIMLLLTLPILSPIAKGIGVDMIWFGVMLTLICNVGAITPPFAMGIFMLKNVGPPDLKLSSLFKGSVPFFIASLVVGLIILLYPPLATWLPGLMMK